MDSSQTLYDKFIDAPIFRPTEEQFKNGPAVYIRNMTKNYPHIPCCVIAPPQSFNPYFSLDQDAFRFKTLKQDFLTNEDVPDDKEFTFREYHTMGDSFKSDYFGRPPNMVPLEEIDENFWSLVTHGEDVQIFSAYRLSSKIHGSGFPNRNSGSFLTKDDEKYLDNPWNLLNVPELEDNTFSVLENQIKENTVPTLDIGMCFSHRGWKRDIHWTYSLNYLHCGDSKLWFAISPDDNHIFEAEILSGATPLPIDLIGAPLNSGELLNNSSKKVKVFKAELRPGHFLVTFPSVYYMNYDSGVNVLESVIIAPVNWLPIGYKAIEYLCDNKQPPLFSHEEMISKLAIDADWLDIDTLKDILANFETIIHQELSLQKAIDNYSTSIKRQRQAFELIPEDNRRCVICGIVLFFSALTCDCDTGRFVCLRHVNHLCEKCPGKIYRFRYERGELEKIINNMKKRLLDYEKWRKEINSLLYNWTDQVPISVLRDLYDTAENKIYPQECLEFERLCNTLQEFEQADKIVQELIEQQTKFTEEENSKRVKYQSSLAQSSARIKKKMESEKDENKNENKSKSKLLLTKAIESDGENRKLNISEFSGFCEVLDTYPFQVSGSEELKKLLLRIYEVDKSMDKILSENTSLEIDSTKLENLIQDANSISFIYFDRKLEVLKEKLVEVKWIEDCAPIFNHDDSIDTNQQHDLNELKSLIESGTNLKAPSNVVNSYLNRLNMIYEEANRWLDKAKDILNTIKQNHSSVNSEKLFLEQIESLLTQSKENPGLRAVDLNPSRQQLEEILAKCQDWLEKANSLMHELRIVGKSKTEDVPYAFQLEDLYNVGKNLGIHFDLLNTMKGALEVITEWKDKVNKTFVRRNSLYPIVNILAPRSNYSLPSSVDIMNCSSRSIYQQLRKFATQNPVREGNKKLTGFEKLLGGDFSFTKIEQVYDKAETEEQKEMQIIREKNIQKNNQIANNESSVDDENNVSNDSYEKDGKSKERDKHSKKFCYCGKSAADWMVQCQLCQEWYHISCVSSYLPFVNLVNKGRKQLLIQNSEDVADQFNFVCILCCRGKRPSLDNIQDLIYSYSKLPTRVLEGELITCLLRRIRKYQEKVKSSINSQSDLKAGFDIVDRNFSLQNESTSQEQNVHGSPSKNKRKSPLVLRKDLTDNPGIELSNESQNILWDLICDGNLLEANVPELQHLWTILLIINVNLKSMVHVNSNSTSLAILASNTLVAGRNKRPTEPESCNEGEAVEAESSRQRFKRRRRDRGVFDRNIKRKNRKVKNETDKNETDKNEIDKNETDNNETENNMDVEPELCSTDCVRPGGQEVYWIFCEGRCQAWFHQLCLGISDPQEVVDIETYFCATCQSLDEAELKNKGSGNRTNNPSSSKTSKSRKKKCEAKSRIGTSGDEISFSPMSNKENCEQEKEKEKEAESKKFSKDLIEDDNAIQIDQPGENACFDLRDVPKVIVDDEETTSCLSEDRIYHETSFESLEESIVENDISNVSRFQTTDDNMQSSSQSKFIQSPLEQPMVCENVPSVLESTVEVTVGCDDNGEIKDYEIVPVISEVVADNYLVVNFESESTRNLKQEQISVGKVETSNADE